MQTLGRLFLSISGGFSLLALAITGTGCTAGQYEANDCQMLGKLTRAQCIEQCAAAGSYGGVCAIPMYELPIKDLETNEVDAQDPNVKTWTCLPKSAPGQSLDQLIPRKHRGFCDSENMARFDITPPNGQPLSPR